MRGKPVPGGGGEGEACAPVVQLTGGAGATADVVSSGDALIDTMPGSGDARPVPFFDVRRQHAALGDSVAAVWADLTASGAFTGGPEVDHFEAEYADFVGADHAVGVANGTDALRLALDALGVGPGDDVLTVSHTFVATVEAIMHTGARPVFVDVDRSSGTMDPGGVAEVLTPATKAIVPVHLYGQSADMAPLLDFARAHDLVVVEDACQAHGAAYRERSVGTMGDAAAFSFYPSKNLGAAGDGGAVTTNDSGLAARLRALREHGQYQKNEHDLVGFTSRLDTVQAAFLRIKLPHLGGWNESRRRIAERYRIGLSGLAIGLPVEMPERRHVYHLYAVRHPRRDSLRTALSDRGVQTGVHYPVPAHLQPAYGHLGYAAGSLPESEAWAAEVLTLPMFPEMTDDEVDRVCDAMREAVEDADVLA